MEHPFINKADLEEKSLEELQESISSLMSKLTFAYRSGNSSMVQQLQMAIDSYRTQYSKKMDEVFAKQKLGNQINVQSDR